MLSGAVDAFFECVSTAYGTPIGIRDAAEPLVQKPRSSAFP